ncbi:uncharacterized protein LOC122023248 [Zingiber officinale]|uniref:uncharacterized protein LOC122023248 n=1 Tax=Zingiber officinale TaxID=94328 RepID=UPI001C4B960E|nr:uncharacterized protein LOC122023248 [Zingiber officinale]
MNENIGDIVLEKAPKNAKYTSPDIQKDILNIFANQVRTKIRKEIGDAKFCILVDEARDTSNKEQMSIVLRFVDIDGFLRERFFAIVHVTDTTAATLKKKISDTLDCSCAYYVHCFAHRLQLALTAAAEKELAIGERDTGRGCNQIGNLLRPGKTCWSSNFDSICNMIDLYSSVITVLENMVYDGSSNSIRGEASDNGVNKSVLSSIAREIFRYLNAMDYVSTTKTLLHTLREEGFAILLSYVKEVCAKYDIEIPQMEARYKSATDCSCQQNDSITVEHHYRFDVFTVAIDFQVEELNSRFKDEAVELLKLSCALEPKENFKLFNVDHIYRLAEKFYSLDFDTQDLHHLRMQLDHYKIDIVGHERFQNLSIISELCRRLIETNKSGSYNLIDRLIRLVLTLPVSTAKKE